MPYRTTLIAIALIAGLTASGPSRASNSTMATSGSSSGWRADVTRHAQQLIDEGFFPGMQVAITRGDKIIYAHGFGLADVETGRPVTDATRFYIASTTKALVATATVLEAAHGSLSLDAPVARYLPDLKLKPPLNANAITVQQLLSMTDGIGECFPVVFRTAYTGVFTRKQIMQLLGNCKASKSGHAFAYRNLPYNILGLVISTDKKENGWKLAVRRTVLDPLGMSETTAHVSALDPDQIAMPHRAGPRGLKRIRLAKNDANLHAAGGYFTTARDLAKFMATQASDGLLDGKRIFPAKVIATTHLKHADQNREFGPYHRYGWGYGWDLGTFDGRKLVHRFGRFSGYRSHASFMPESGIGVVVLVNGVAAPYAVDQMANYIYNRIDASQPAGVDARYRAELKKLQDLKARFARHLAKQAKTQSTRQEETLPHPRKAYTGVYENPQLGSMTWTLRGNQLQVAIGEAQCDAQIYAADKNQFRVELTGGGEVITFRFHNHDATPASLEYNGYTFKPAGAKTP
ncbi:MAG: serine hydrolase domain-containing protein [Rhodanobacteraceae bacterium]